jgi:esterase/lipase
VRDRFENIAKIDEVSAPILILHGRVDRMVSFTQAQSLARNSSSAHLKLFDHIGHELAYLDEARDAELSWLGSVLEFERTDRRAHRVH